MAPNIISGQDYKFNVNSTTIASADVIYTTASDGSRPFSVLGNGSASFAREVEVGDYSGGNTGIIITSGGGLGINHGASSSSSTDAVSLNASDQNGMVYSEPTVLLHLKVIFRLVMLLLT